MHPAEIKDAEMYVLEHWNVVKMAQTCLIAGLERKEIEEFSTFVHGGGAMVPIDVINYVKRRAVRTLKTKPGWGRTCHEWVRILEEIRTWAKTRTPEGLEQVQLMNVFISQIRDFMIAADAGLMVEGEP